MKHVLTRPRHDANDIVFPDEDIVFLIQLEISVHETEFGIEHLRIHFACNLKAGN